MFFLKVLLCCLIVLIGVQNFLGAQVFLQSMGLENKNITSIGLYGNIIAVGTIGNGVFWSDSLINTTWMFLGLDSAEVYSVYPHKSGPVGWAIGAGLKPDSNFPHFIYCSFAGTPFEPKDTGISDSVAVLIHVLDGFPDPSICGETYAAAGGALYRRNFTDTVWTPVYSATVEGYVRTVKVREEYPGVVLTGGAEGFAGRLLLKSLDFGDTWEWLSPPGFVRDIDFIGASAQTIFVVAGNVYRSLYGGQSWTEIFNTSWIWINKIAYDTQSSTIYIAGADDIYHGNAMLLYSQDMGNNWQQAPIWIQNPIVDMELSNDGWLYFATPDSGVFRFNTTYVGLNHQSDDAVVEKYELLQNYPNPYNPETTISFDLPRTSEVTLKIFNILGEHVTTLVSKRLLAGNHQYKWNAGSLASGVYLYRLEAAGFVQTKKMILMR